MFQRSASTLASGVIAVLAGLLGAMLLLLIISPQTVRAAPTTWTVTSSSDDVNDGSVTSHTGSLRFVLAHAVNGDNVGFHIVGVDKIYIASPLTVPVGVAVGYPRTQPCGDYHAPRINVEAYSTSIDPVFYLSANSTLRNIDIGGGRISVRVVGSNVDVCGSALGVEYDSDGVGTPLPPTSLALSIDGDHAVIHRNYLNGQIAISPRGSDSRLGDTLTGTGEINEGVHDAAVTVLSNATGAAQRVTLRDPFPRSLFGIAGTGVSGGDDVITHTNNWAQQPAILSAYTPDNFATVQVRGIANPWSVVDIFFNTQVSVTRQLPVVADATGAFFFTGNLPGPNVLVYAASTLNDPAHPNRQGSSSQFSASVQVVQAPPPPALQVSPSLLTYTSVLSGADPAAQNLLVTVLGVSPPLPWHAVVSTSNGMPWLSATPLTGSSSGFISVTAHSAGLTPGTYQGTVTVIDNAHPADQVSVAVTYVLSAPVPSGYTLTFPIVGNGSVIRSPDLPTYPAGATVLFKAIPNLGSSFAGWSGAVSGTKNPNGIKLYANQTVTATFVPMSYTLTIHVVGNGSVLRSPDMAAYPAGSGVLFKAIPNAGSSFAGWSGAVSGTRNPNGIRLNANQIVTATFTSP